MDHSSMQNRKATSVFSIKSAAASWKVFKDEEEEEEEVEEISTRTKKQRLMHLGGGKTAPAGGCQVEKCVADLTDSKRYHQRHKVCEYHSKAQVVIVAGLTQRFCQQCSRFHELFEFDDAKRSCRRRLAGHNERRRKHFSRTRGEASAAATTAGRRGSTSGSGSQMEKKQCSQVEERGRNQIAQSENSHIH